MTQKTLAHTYFDQLASKYIQQYSEASLGSIMSVPALQMNNRAAAFYTPNQEMVFRLGADFSFNHTSLKNIQVFQPFKNRAPLLEWFVVPFSEKEHWPRLTELALIFTLSLTRAA